jgi:hypothetical protein
MVLILFTENPKSSTDLTKVLIWRYAASNNEFAKQMGSYFEDVNVQNGVQYEYRIVHQDNGKETEIGTSRPTKAGELTPVPMAPTLEAITAGDKIAFKVQIDFNNLFAVNIYKAITKDSLVLLNSQPIIPNDKNAIVYIDKNVSDNKSYSYAVKGVTYFGKLTNYGVTQQVNFIDTVAPVAAFGLTITNSGNSNKLTWNKSTDNKTASYHVLRYKNQTNSPEVVAILDTTQNEFTDKVSHPGMYSYRVKTIGTNNKYALSNKATADIKDTISPCIPDFVEYKFDSNTLTLNWKNCVDKDLKGYLVYRSNNDSEENYSLATPQPIYANKYIESTNRTGKQKISFKIVSIDTLGNISSYSKKLVVVSKDFTPPAKPRLDDIFIEQSATKIKLYQNQEADFMRLMIMRSDNGEKPYLIKPSIKFEPPFILVTDMDIQPGKTYQYFIISVDSNNNFSEATVTRKILLPALIEKPSTPYKVRANFDTKRNEIMLSWVYKGTDHNGFVVYKKANDGIFKPATGLMKEPKFFDSDFIPGSTYYYEVRVYGNDGKYSKSDITEIRTLTKN